MKRSEAIRVTSDLAASQKGFFTSVQANAAGVGSLELSRLVASGTIERIMHGLYHASGAPSFREDAVFAAWLLLDPAIPSYSRELGPEGFIASHGTAAWLYGFGEVNPEPYTFTAPKRHQSRRKGLRITRGHIEAHEIEIVCGIPVTRPKRIVLDLLSDGEDLSLIASVLANVSTGATERDDAYMARIDSKATKYGFDDGFPLYQYMIEG